MPVSEPTQSRRQRFIKRCRDHEECLRDVLVAKPIRIVNAAHACAHFFERVRLLARLAILFRTDNDAIAALEVQPNGEERRRERVATNSRPA